jgi:diguanylate cyclase
MHEPITQALPPDDGASARELQRRGIKRLALTIPGHVVAILAMSYSAWQGTAETWAATLLSSFLALGVAVFYLILRSGWANRLPDPMLTFPQVVTNITFVALAYALLPGARVVALEWLCLIIIYDIQRLGLVQMRLSASLAMALPAIALVLTQFAGISHEVLAHQLVFLGWGAVMVPALLLVGNKSRQIRKRQIKQKEELAQAVSKLHELAIRDSLTGIINRRHMQSLLDAEERRYKRSRRNYCVAILDLDSFKEVNDRFGHGVGDQVLRHFGALCHVALDQSPDQAARWGGEEFLLLMPDANLARAHAVVSRMRVLVLTHDWTRIHPDLRITFSAGLCERADVADDNQALVHADKALYEAKRLGRDRLEAVYPFTEAVLHDSDAFMKGLPILDVGSLSQLVDACLARDQDQHPALADLKVDPAKAHPTHRANGKWTNLILGSTSRMRNTAFNCLVAAAIYLVMSLSIVFHGLPNDLVTPLEAQLLLSMCLMAALLPYPLVRSGLTSGLKDHGLQVPQMAWAMLTIITGYVLIEATRANVLQIMCVVLMFGFMSLQARQVVLLGVLASVFLVLGEAVVLLTGAVHGPTHQEVMHVLISVFIYALITAQAYNFAQVRQAVRKEKRDLQQAAEQIRHITTHDNLTGLPNRQFMKAVLDNEMERHERSGHGFSIALIDLDFFKRVNDTHGHQAGDTVLLGFGRTATEMLRATDVLARWGGEEFLVMLPGAPGTEHAALVLERLRNQIAAKREWGDLLDLQVTISAGVAAHIRGEPIDHLLERADKALYRAKNQGRNRTIAA